MDASTSYIPTLDGFRAIAFLFVFLTHTMHRSFARFVPQRLGVTIFFFLSGYLITTLLRREMQKTGRIALRDFYIRRALRIFIPLYVAYAAVALMNHVFGLETGNVRGLISALFYYYNYARMLSPATLVPEGFNIIWSLSVEEHFYIFFPLLYLFLLRSRLSVAHQARVLLSLCLIGMGWRTWVNYHHVSDLWTYTATDCRFDSILWGSLLAVWNNPRYDAPAQALKRYGGLLAACSLAIMALDLVLIKSPDFRESFRYSLQGVCLYFIFHFAISSADHWSVRWLEARPLRFIGWLSYSLYLIHLAVFDVLLVHLPHVDWIIGSTCLAISLAYATLIRYTVELPLQRLRSRFRHAALPVSQGSAVEGI